MTNEPTPAASPPLDDRKSKVLRAVVEEHIATGQPVGSTHLTAVHELRVSAATVRNEMHQLERDGYLTHPHTSAGRIPTDRGYRFFVDQVGSSARLASPKVAKVRDFFAQAHRDLEQMLEHTSRLLADLTDYAAVVVAPPTGVATVRSIQLVGLGPATRDGDPCQLAVLVVVLSNGSIEKRTVQLDPTTSEQHLSAATAHLGAVIGRTVSGMGIHPLLRTGDELVDAATVAALVAIGPEPASDAPTSDVFVGGTSRMVSAFDAVHTIRTVLSALEEQVVVVNLLREAMERSVSVSIGAEHGSDDSFESLLTCSVVVAPYLVEGRAAGTIGVLGPTRMNYPQAMAAVTMVSDGLSGRLGEGAS